MNDKENTAAKVIEDKDLEQASGGNFHLVNDKNKSGKSTGSELSDDALADAVGGNFHLVNDRKKESRDDQ